MTTTTYRLPPASVPRTTPVSRPVPRFGVRTARMLALAYHVEQLIERGEFESYAAVARHLDISTPRIAQVMALLGLASDVQERLLLGDTTIPERRIRAAVRFADWNQQRAALKE